MTYRDNKIYGNGTYLWSEIHYWSEWATNWDWVSEINNEKFKSNPKIIYREDFNEFYFYIIKRVRELGILIRGGPPI